MLTFNKKFGTAGEAQMCFLQLICYIMSVHEPAYKFNQATDMCQCWFTKGESIAERTCNIYTCGERIFLRIDIRDEDSECGAMMKDAADHVLVHYTIEKD